MKIKEKTTNKNNKNGISLIVLVITIIVMIILAAAIILSLSSNGLINRANEAVDKTDKAQVQNLASLKWADAYLDGKRSEGALRAEVVKGLKNSGITEQDYVVFANESGVDVMPSDSWDHIYTYSETMGWSTKITKEDEIEDKNPTIIAKFYKTGKKTTLPKEAIDMFQEAGSTIETEQDEYKMVMSGNGNMGIVANESDGTFVAWMEELMKLITGEAVAPTMFFTTEVIIEEGIENISSMAFFDWFSLKSVTMDNSVLKIEDKAFENCFNLSFIGVPISTEIDEDVFYNCKKLANIHVSSKEEWENKVKPNTVSYEALLNATVTYDYRTNVEMLANEGWQKAYDSGKKTQSALETAVTEYLETNNMSSEELALYNIDITTKGVNITSKTVTLSDTISSALDYGKTVNYSANGINDWKVLYKQRVDDEEYVYLIASEKVDGNKLPTNIPGAIIEGADIYWKLNKAPSVVASGTINSTRWLANWSDYSTNENGRCVSYFLDENYWTAFKNTSKYGDNVVGAIGTPTLEMFAASYNERSEALGDTGENSILTLTNGDTGYKINENYSTNLSRIDRTYSWNSKYIVWLASPSANNPHALFSVNYYGFVGNGDYSNAVHGLRPVVCLKSSIPARVGVSVDNADIILK